ncbi:hypothetical protein GN956_G5946 [Arapaima gigas]
MNFPARQKNLFYKLEDRRATACKHFSPKRRYDLALFNPAAPWGRCSRSCGESIGVDGHHHHLFQVAKQC